MHYKYSSMMNIIFITFMYGAGLPKLFPLAFAAFVVFFALEKYMMYYVYQSPPAYDELLNEAVLNKLAYAPLFLLGFGYWILTNNQLRDNDFLKSKLRKSDPFDSEHYWY